MGNTTVRSTFFGTSSIYITDGTTGVFTDAFVSRPNLLKVALGRIEPNLNRIRSALVDGAVGPLDAVFTAHSHYDHALDSAVAVKLKGGILYGSESTLNVGRGNGLGESQLHNICDGDEYRFGNFFIRVFEGTHSPGDHYPGTIDAPLRPPAKAEAYKNRGTFSFLVTHPTGTIFIHPSANFVPYQFDGIQADLIYLGIGALGAQDEKFRSDYWRHTVEAIKPQLVIPVHWDNFGRPLTRKLRPLPRFLDKFKNTKEFLNRKSAEGGPVILWQDALETITPFQR